MLPARAGSTFIYMNSFGAYSNQEGPKSDNVEKTFGFTTIFKGSKGEGGFIRPLALGVVR